MADKKDNLAIWNKVKRPPKEVLKTIKGGRISGMTDISPQWRIKIMTEMFGSIGDGWTYSIVDKWTQAVGQEVMCFVEIDLNYKLPDGQWSSQVKGIGGSMLAEMEKKGLHVSDEGWKMALTDAISVAMKQIGVAADIYAGLWDGSKYKDAPKETATLVTSTEMVRRAFETASNRGDITCKEYENLIIKYLKKLPDPCAEEQVNSKITKIHNTINDAMAKEFEDEVINDEPEAPMSDEASTTMAELFTALENELREGEALNADRLNSYVWSKYHKWPAKKEDVGKILADKNFDRKQCYELKKAS